MSNTNTATAIDTSNTSINEGPCRAVCILQDALERAMAGKPKVAFRIWLKPCARRE